MNNRSNQETEYVVVRDSQPKKPIRYYYDPDDEGDSMPLTTRRVVRRKPVKEQRTQYVTKEVPAPEYRRTRVAGSTDRKIQLRNSNSERFILDENDNIIKIIRSHRARTPPLPETRQYQVHSREPRTLYYETADGHLVACSPKHPTVRNAKSNFAYAEEEPTQIVRRVVRNPRTGLFETIYEKHKPKKPMQQKYVIRKRSDEILVNSDNEPQQQLLQLPLSQPQPQYVQVVQQQAAAPKQEASSPQKYVIIRKKVDPEPVYTLASSDMPNKTTRRIVYQTAPKKAPMTYMYATNEPFYK